MMGPAEGTSEYARQVEEVFGMFKLYGPTNKTEEDNVILLYVMDTSYSRSAVMEALGRYREYYRSLPK